ncbi:class I SAM-dependent methyltransferase [bacterium]|nr:class I SAM-dependent methyltransferase [bacterium]
MDKRYAQYLLVKTRRDYNQIAEEFSRTRSFLWDELKPLINYVKDGDRVLDVGCGNGRLLSALRDKEVNYIGIDSSEKLIDIAREKFRDIENAQFLVVEALNLPFENNNFHKVYSIAVLHHIPSLEYRLKFLEEIRRVLKPKGLLILTVWNLRDLKPLLLLKYTILKIIGKSDLDWGDVFYPWKSAQGSIERYVHCFSKRELVDLVKKAGFLVKDSGFLTHGRFKKANIYVVAQKPVLTISKESEESLL